MFDGYEMKKTRSAGLTPSAFCCLFMTFLKIKLIYTLEKFDKLNLISRRTYNSIIKKLN